MLGKLEKPDCVPDFVSNVFCF